MSSRIRTIKTGSWHALSNVLTTLKQNAAISTTSFWVRSSQTFQIHIVLYTQSELISHTLTALPCPKDLWEEVIHLLGISTLLSASSTLHELETSLKAVVGLKQNSFSSLNSMWWPVLPVFVAGNCTLVLKRLRTEVQTDQLIWRRCQYYNNGISFISYPTAASCGKAEVMLSGWLLGAAMGAKSFFSPASSRLPQQRATLTDFGNGVFVYGRLGTIFLN